MTAETHHDLAHEFPEMKDIIHDLKTTDNHFRRLFDEYEKVAKELQRKGDTMCDMHIEDLKKHRLELKDALYKMMTGKKGGCGKKSCCCN